MIQNFLKISVVVFGLLSLASCGDDSILDTNPSISFGGSTGADATLKAGETFTVTLSGSKNEAELNGLEIRENGVKVDVSLIKFKGSNVGGNPILLTQTDREGFSNLEVIITTGTTVGVSSYDFILLDASNNSDKVTKKVTIDAAVPPTVTYNGTSPVSLGLQALHSFNFTAVKGSGDLVTIEVKENGIPMDKSRLEFDNVAFLANPTTLNATYHGGFTGKNITLRTSAIAGDYEYTFIFGDLSGTETEVKVSAKVGTALIVNKEGVVFNMSGQENGAMDLDTGDNVPSNSANSEIQDLGIDINLPVATNWIQKIRAENGATMRLVDKSLLSETFTFASITYNEELLNKLWPNAGEVVGDSPKVVAGNIFVVKKGANYYAFEVAEVVVTTNDNNDYYRLNIKH